MHHEATGAAEQTIGHPLSLSGTAKDANHAKKTIPATEATEIAERSSTINHPSSMLRVLRASVVHRKKERPFADFGINICPATNAFIVAGAVAGL
jgi:hypothetical protein